MTYDSGLVSYEDLLEAFWKQIDPTQVNGQGGDRGTQYRTGIYAHNEEQLQIAEASKSKIAEDLKVRALICGGRFHGCKDASPPSSMLESMHAR